MLGIASELDRALARRRSGEPGGAVGRLLAQGDGWSVLDVICTFGPSDRSFEEQHSRVSIAIVAAGSFQYRSTSGRALLTPGSVLLGNVGHCFECGHDHAAGDRCVAFNLEPAFFERIAADAGAPDSARRFDVPSIPPLRDSARAVVAACAALLAEDDVSWEEIVVDFTARVAQLASDRARLPAEAPAHVVARVTDVVRFIEGAAGEKLTLRQLADVADLSPFHFLRTFQRVTGVTPHQYVRRARLRAAATRLATEETKVIDVAFESGFDDVANFNRAFRQEFGAHPLAYRRRVG